jgi:hypothetical protein
MRRVVFSHGAQPSIGGADALALAELLGRRSSVAAATVARKLRAAAAATPGIVAPANVELTRAETLALAAVLESYDAPEAGAVSVEALRRSLAASRQSTVAVPPPGRR